MILAIAAMGFASMLLFMALLAVCRGFAASESGVREAYEHRLWAKYAVAYSHDTKKAA